jgi:hypothetical protein
MVRAPTPRISHLEDLISDHSFSSSHQRHLIFSINDFGRGKVACRGVRLVPGCTDSLPEAVLKVHIMGSSSTQPQPHTGIGEILIMWLLVLVALPLSPLPLVWLITTKLIRAALRLCEWRVEKVLGGGRWVLWLSCRHVCHPIEKSQFMEYFSFGGCTLTWAERGL